MKSGDVITRDNAKVMVLAWKDKRIVKVISTKHSASVSFVTRRKKKGGGQMEKVKNQIALLITTNICLVWTIRPVHTTRHTTRLLKRHSNGQRKFLLSNGN